MSDKQIFRSCSDFKVKAETDDFPGGTVEGYASVFGNRDAYDEAVMPGAFADDVAAFNAGTAKYPLMTDHDMRTEAVIGRVVALEERKRGLWFKAALSTVAAAQEVRQKLIDGTLRALSFGYRVVKDELDNTVTPPLRKLLKLKLFEISVVVFPANPRAAVTVAKGALDDGMSEVADILHASRRRTLLKEVGAGMRAFVAARQAHRATVVKSRPSLDQAIRRLESKRRISTTPEPEPSVLDLQIGRLDLSSVDRLNLIALHGQKEIPGAIPVKWQWPALKPPSAQDLAIIRAQRE